MDNSEKRCEGTGYWRRAHLRCLLVLTSLFLCGCEWIGNGFKVGPNYTPATQPIAEHWIDYQRPPEDQGQTQATELKQWWRVFNDPVLNSLISDAYKQNLSLRAAGERIEEGRALRGIAVGNLFPQNQNMAGSTSVNKVSGQTANAQQAEPDQWFSQTQVGFNMNWELDLWGHFRRSIEAADANLDASIANYDDVLVVLLADVSADYIQYRTYQERLNLARINVSIQEAAYQLASDNFRLGRSTERDPQMARQVLEQTRSAIPDLEAGLRRTSDALCVLLGITVQDLNKRLGDSGVIPKAQLSWSVGIPADLLRRRPDVRRAERQAAAESAGIGIAKSALYPKFYLNGSIGVQAEQVGDLFKNPSSMIGTFGPAFQWDILNYGRIENSVKAQEARFREFVAQYQQTVLNANREVEDSLINYFMSQERYKSLSLSVDAAQRTVEITNDQYRNGAVDFTPVFIFEAALTSQQDAQALAQSDTALSLVDVYRSLGGGWDEKQDAALYEAPAAPAPTTQRAPTSLPTMLPSTTGPKK
jgi:NodT family efflux transporter outer membrane factor (OMF) lipoprotein